MSLRQALQGGTIAMTLALLGLAGVPAEVSAQSCAACVTRTVCYAAEQGTIGCTFDDGICEQYGFGCKSIQTAVERLELDEDLVREFEVDGDEIIVAKVAPNRYARWDCDEELSAIFERTANGRFHRLDVNLYRDQYTFEEWVRTASQPEESSS